MRNLELLIDKSRKLSQNTRYDSNSGVPQDVFVQYFQNAQDFLVRSIYDAKTKFFIKSGLVTIVSGQESYDYPADIYLQAIDTMEWSDDNISWITLDLSLAKDRLSSEVGYAYGYICMNSAFILSPPPSNGNLRLTYSRAPNRLEKRSAKVVSVTGSPITSITTDATFSGDDMSYINMFNYISVVDKYGKNKITKIPISAAAGATISVENYILAAGETIVAGDYILSDQKSTNLPELPDMCESFLILHATYQAKYGDSSQWSKVIQEDVKNHAAQIISNFGLLRDDISYIPIINSDYLAIW